MVTAHSHSHTQPDLARQAASSSPPSTTFDNETQDTTVIVNKNGHEPYRLKEDPPIQSDRSHTRVAEEGDDINTERTTAEPGTTNNPGVHMDLATFPTENLIHLVASLLQRIAAANDRLRRDKSNVGGDTPGLHGVQSPSAGGKSGSGAGGSSGSGRQRASSRPNPAEMVIPPYKPKPSMVESDKAAVTTAATATTATTTVDQGSGKGGSSLVGDDVQVGTIRSSDDPPSSTSNKPSIDPPLTQPGASTTNPTSSPPPITSTQQPAPSTSTSPAPAPALPSQQPPPTPPWPTTAASRHAVAHPSSLLCFHARNVPSISIETYLQRILKYCPVTNDVFLSLLVYFDRMSKKLVPKVASAGEGQSKSQSQSASASGVGVGVGNEEGSSTVPSSSSGSTSTSTSTPEEKGFAIDSYNVHRLVIAGVTISSKFHSDVFYTNSRYAKVGGLPQTELNQLELQFLLLNDFTLAITLEEMQRYADRLLIYGQDGQDK